MIKTNENLSLLLVDDEKDIVSSLKNGIVSEFSHWKVFEAFDGGKALNILESVKCDIMFLDYGLPKYNGGKVVEELKFLPKSRHPLFIFIISGDDHQHMEIKTKSRVIKYISKPFKVSEVIATLKQTIDDFTSAQTPTKKAGGNFDVKFLNPFIDSTIKVLEVTANIKSYKESVEIRKESTLQGDISALYPIHSSLINSLFILSFPNEVFLRIMSKMLYEEQTEVSEDNQDGAGELCKQILGNAKVIFNEKFKIDLKSGTPATFLGNNQKLINKNLGLRLSVEFTTDFGPFYVEIALNKSKT